MEIIISITDIKYTFFLNDTAATDTAHFKERLYFHFGTT